MATADAVPPGAIVPRPPLLAAARLAPPRRPARWVERAAQRSLLDAGLQRRLTVVSAPAGSGKTTLLADWWQGLPERHGAVPAWLSVEADDDEAAAFAAGLLAALEDALAPPARDALRLLAQEPQVPPRVVVTTLLNELGAHAAPVVLVLDDAHRLASAAVQDLLLRLVRHAPEHLHVVLAGRGAPPLPLSEFRLRDQLAWIGADALRFDAQQSRDFFARCTPPLPAGADGAALGGTVDGWAAGLQLLALGLPGATAPAPREVDAYLQEHVLAALPAADLDFIAACALPARVTAALASVLTSRADAAEQLARCERDGLFLHAQDREPTWYRFDRPFRESLLRRLAVRPAAELEALHRAAAAWFGGAREWDDAVHHALAAGEAEQAADWIESGAMERIGNGQARPVLAWIERLPAAALEGRPRLRMAQAWALAMALRTAEAAAALQSLRLALAGGQLRLPAGAQAELDTVAAAVAALNDDSAEALRLARRTADAAVPATSWIAEIGRSVTLYGLLAAADFEGVGRLLHERPAAGTAPVAHGRAYRRSMVGAAALAAGELRNAGRLLQDALADAAASTGALSAAAVLPAGYLAALHYEWNDLAQAGALVQDRLEAARETAPLGSLAASVLVSARLAALRGEPEAARDELAQGDALAERRGWSRMRVALGEERIRLAVQGGEVAAAVQLVSELASRLPIAPPPQRSAVTEAWLMLQACRCRVWLATGRAAEAEASLRAQLAEWLAARMPYRATRVRILLALALAQGGWTDSALEELAEALRYGQQQGLVRSLVDEGEPARRLVLALQRARSDALPAWYGGALLAAWGSDAAPATDVGGAARLSAREVEILDFIAQGLSNKEIARSLRLAPETVKWHLKNVYEKLDVSTRVQAVQRGLGRERPLRAPG